MTVTRQSPRRAPSFRRRRQQGCSKQHVTKPDRLSVEKPAEASSGPRLYLEGAARKCVPPNAGYAAVARPGRGPALAPVLAERRRAHITL